MSPAPLALVFAHRYRFEHVKAVAAVPMALRPVDNQLNRIAQQHKLRHWGTRHLANNLALGPRELAWFAMWAVQRPYFRVKALPDVHPVWTAAFERRRQKRKPMSPKRQLSLF